MAYSETRIVIGGLAHVPVLIFIANFIKGKFGIKKEETKDAEVKELSNKLDSIEQKADEVYEKVKKKKKDKKKKKKNN